MQKDLKVVIGIFIVSSVLLLGMEAKTEIKSVMPESKIDSVITIPHGNFDIGNKERGTITINMDSNHYNQMILEKKDRNVKSLIFFSSKVMPGLEIRYNIKEQVFEAGIPPFKSTSVELLNGQQHTLAFTYQLGEKQAIYFDGQNIGYRPFVSYNRDQISGFAIKGYGTEEIIVESLASKMRIADYVISEEELLAR
ncbi:hypothetical protein J4418_04280 [Candidatus Woesearchaeota archaeon]|nr:hypothetical protein [Candidatus Woesearchaeota archaeon]